MSFATDVQTIVIGQALGDIHSSILRHRRQDVEYQQLRDMLAFARETNRIAERTAAKKRREEDLFASVARKTGRKFGRIA